MSRAGRETAAQVAGLGVVCEHTPDGAASGAAFFFFFFALTPPLGVTGAAWEAGLAAYHKTKAEAAAKPKPKGPKAAKAARAPAPEPPPPKLEVQPVAPAAAFGQRAKLPGIKILK